MKNVGNQYYSIANILIILRYIEIQQIFLSNIRLHKIIFSYSSTLNILFRYGRVTALALGGFVAAILGIIRSFATSYTYFVIFEFLDSMASSPLYSICFIVGIELVGPKRRVIACSLITIFYAIGEMVLALCAKFYPNWRILLRIMYIPALLLVMYFWILPESVRWLLSQNREDDAKKILKRAAKVNKRKLSEHSLDKLILANREKLENVSEGKFPIKQAFSKLFWRIANCSFCWIVNVLVYYGLSLNAVLLDGDKYNNFIFIAMVEIPGFLLPLIIMDRFGRRYSLFGCMFISGLCCLATIFMPPGKFKYDINIRFLILNYMYIYRLSLSATIFIFNWKTNNNSQFSSLIFFYI